MQIKWIIGMAGTAKTTTLKTIQDNYKGTSIAVAFTHSACNNMIDKGMRNIYTIHSFFKVMPNTTFINITYVPDLLLIDEFSMIPVELLLSIFDRLKQHDVLIVCAGDLLQLPPVIESDLINIKNLNLSGSCSLEDAKRIYMTLGKTIYGYDYYIKYPKMILTKNYRSDTTVMKILNDILNTGTINIEPFEVMEGYVCIASTYENLRKMRTQDSEGFKTRVGIVKVSDKPYILTENVNEVFHNGDEVKVLNYEPDNILGRVLKIQKGKETMYLKENDYGVFDILPTDYITIHYAQGRGYDRVCLCVDDLFELGMLYTGITRTRKEIKFVSFKSVDSIDVSNIIRPFNIMKDNIYRHDL